MRGEVGWEGEVDGYGRVECEEVERFERSISIVHIKRRIETVIGKA